MKLRFKTSLGKYFPFIILFIFSVVSCLSFGYKFRPVHTLSLFLILIVLCNANVRIYQFFIVIIGLVSACYMPMALTYGEPDFNAVVNIYQASAQESGEFLKAIPWFYSLSILPGILLTIAALSVKIEKLKYRRCYVLIIIVYFCAPGIKSYFKYGNLSEFNIGLPIFKASNEAVENYRQVLADQALLRQQVTVVDSWDPKPRATAYQLYILVIGESVRSDYLQAYGFKADNTEFISSSFGIIFSNYISAASSTMTSLLNSLTLGRNGQHETNNNIITLAKKSGFATYWYSNQGLLGSGETPVSIIAMNADKNIFLKKGDYQQNSYIPDSNMLLGIRDGINEKKPLKLIVIHLIGSHPRACTRTNNKYSLFSQSKEISCYIESVHQTDKLLSDIAEMAKASGERWSMMYFADHGLSFENSDTSYARLHHDDRFKQNYTVPMFITASDSHEHKVINQPRSGLHFLSLFSQWTGIKDRLIDDSCDMLANTRCENQDTVIKFNLERAAFSSLPEDVAAH